MAAELSGSALRASGSVNSGVSEVVESETSGLEAIGASELVDPGVKTLASGLNLVIDCELGA